MPFLQVVASTTTFDLETQPTLPLPTTVVTKITRMPPSTLPVQRCPLDDFFGYTLSTTRTHESRHDPSFADMLPPYVEDMPPTHSLRPPEPVTLAKYLFNFGFLFPPFWILGSCILWLPLHAPTNHSNVEIAWMADKSELGRQRVIAEMRRVEICWALRCLWALLILTMLAVIAGIAAWVVLHS
ncbi:hypothetical protein E4T56_gene17959 [Termitomyces sp. T112]|nr:hypothetical protein E4T56_gene17959 [Termitomyces sp. T112]KAH0585466.1 hypothetical protein H2248_008706 [Termitomyces sp. 'cryptogamus']